MSHVHVIVMRDADCVLDETTGCCVECGVLHGEPCERCGGSGYHVDGCGEESPLDRDIREVEEAFTELKQRLRDCRSRSGGASAEEMKRYTIALESLKLELRDLGLRSENA